MTLYVCWFVTYFSVIVRANNQIKSLHVSNKKKLKYLVKYTPNSNQNFKKSLNRFNNQPILDLV